MRKLLFIALPLLILTSCDNGAAKREISQLKAQVDSLEQIVKTQRIMLSSKSDSISILSYPADQRLSHINQLIKEESFDQAKKEVAQLVKVFPNSKEASNKDQLIAKIDDLIAKKEAEEQRLKALGFKAIKPTPSWEILYNKVSFSLSISNIFTFDDYGSQYFYRDADRGYKYITGSMRITSTSSNPMLPCPQLYIIEGDKMTINSSFDVRFSRWKDYGTYLGNYHDSGNDFRKTSTITFKVGAMIHTDYINSKPVAVVLKNDNILVREEEKYSNPPVKYTGSYGKYPETLSLEDFTSGEYLVVKYFNF